MQLVPDRSTIPNPMSNSRLDRVSFWFDSLDSIPVPEAPNELPTNVDIAIVGGGFTGLWTAYYLKWLQPDLDVVVLEAMTVGFGASGRNGGWCMGTAAGVDDLLADPTTRDSGARVLLEMMATVDEVRRVCQAENIDCHYAKGGTLAVAHAPFMVKRLRAEVDGYGDHGFAEYCHWLPPEEARRRINCTRNHGAIYTPHCAAIHPARLARGLGEAIRRRGVRVFESTPVLDIHNTTAVTTRGTLKADIVIRATEGYTDSLASHKRRLIPLYSLMVATEPLPDEVWDEIGILRRETFDDRRRATTYGQRTADGRIAFGGNERYLFGSKRNPFITPENTRFTELESTLKQMFPILENYEITHRWGGLMGITTDGQPYVYLNRIQGFGAAGGYVGEGVGAANLVGRIMADLILERDTDITHLPWVNDDPSRWPIEPLRWLGGTTLTFLANQADRVELSQGERSTFWGSLFKFVANQLF